MKKLLLFLIFVTTNTHTGNSDDLLTKFKALPPEAIEQRIAIENQEPKTHTGNSDDLLTKFKALPPEAIE